MRSIEPMRRIGRQGLPPPWPTAVASTMLPRERLTQVRRFGPSRSVVQAAAPVERVSNCDVGQNTSEMPWFPTQQELQSLREARDAGLPSSAQNGRWPRGRRGRVIGERPMELYR